MENGVKKHVIVIGAGPAGLTAAYELLAEPEKYAVTILEEDTRIGGISKTVRHAGNRMDLGGHRFFSKDETVMAWWKKILPIQGSLPYDDRKLGRTSPTSRGGPDPETEDRVMLVRSRVSRIYWGGRFFDYPISLTWDTFKDLGFGTALKAGFSFLFTCFRKLPEDSLENFYINRFGKVLYSLFFESYTAKVWGRHPRDISADWGSQRVKGLSAAAILGNMLRRLLPGKAKKVETSLIGEFYYPKFGPGQLWETVAGEITKRGGALRFGSPVTGIRTDGRKVVGAECGGDFLSGDVFLSSMPVKDLVMGIKDAPADIRRIAGGLPYRDFVTVGLLVDRLVLRNRTRIKTLGGIVPDCWIYVQDAGVKLGRIQIFNNWSPYMVRDPENTVWIGLEYFCAENDEFWNLPEEDCVAFAVGELRKIGVIGSDAKILGSCRERVKKAYPAYFDTYSEIGRLIEYLDQFENLYCIGRNGQHRYNNMDHSMLTAFRAVDHIRGVHCGRADLWNVNTEKEYHEKRSE